MSEQAYRRIQQTAIALVLALVGADAGQDLLGGGGTYPTDRKFILEQLAETDQRLDHVATQLATVAEAQASLAATLETYIRMDTPE
jgi:hypothetical protein